MPIAESTSTPFPSSSVAARVHVLRWHADRASRDREVDAVLAQLPAAEDGPPRLARLPSGQPYAHGSSAPLHLNLSHSGELLLLALAPVPCGIDVERLGRGRDFRRIAEHYFDVDECRWLARGDDTALEKRFLRLWVAKEAVLKAHGLGIGSGLRATRFDPGVDPPRLIGTPDPSGDPGDWRIHWFTPGEGYVAALAVASPEMDWRVMDGAGGGATRDRMS